MLKSNLPGMVVTWHQRGPANPFRPPGSTCACNFVLILPSRLWGASSSNRALRQLAPPFRPMIGTPELGPIEWRSDPGALREHRLGRGCAAQSCQDDKGQLRISFLWKIGLWLSDALVGLVGGRHYEETRGNSACQEHGLLVS